MRAACRDVDDTCAAARMRHMRHDEPHVTCIVTLNRCQYAQLSQQRYAPPRAAAAAVPPPGHPGHKAADLGIKITAGFEILCARAAAAGEFVPAPPPPPSPSNPTPTAVGDGVAAGAGSHAAAVASASVASTPAASRHPLGQERVATAAPSSASSSSGAQAGPDASVGANSADDDAEQQQRQQRQQLQAHPGWPAFLGSLDRNGYFDGNIPGSAR